MAKTDKPDVQALQNFGTDFEAEIASGMLNEAEIPHIVQSQAVLLGMACPGATIFVSKTLLDEARQVLGIDDNAPTDQPE